MAHANSALPRGAMRHAMQAGRARGVHRDLCRRHGQGCCTWGPRLLAALSVLCSRCSWQTCRQYAIAIGKPTMLSEACTDTEACTDSAAHCARLCSLSGCQRLPAVPLVASHPPTHRGDTSCLPRGMALPLHCAQAGRTPTSSKRLPVFYSPHRKSWPVRKGSLMWCICLPGRPPTRQATMGLGAWPSRFGQ